MVWAEAGDIIKMDVRLDDAEIFNLQHAPKSLRGAT